MDFALSLFSWLLQVGGFVAGPLLAWRLHRRAFDKVGLISLLVGFLTAGVLVAPLVLLGPLLQWLVARFTDQPYAGAIAYLVLLLLAFFAVLVLLVVDASRDLSAARRHHVSLDIGRMLAALAVVVFASVVVAQMIAGEDALEAGAFVLLAAAQGAAVVAIAGTIGLIVERRREARPTASPA